MTEEPEDTGTWLTYSKRERGLVQRINKLEAALSIKTLEAELLATLNEQMRQWVLASTAAASAISQGFGAPREPNANNGNVIPVNMRRQ